MAAATAVLLDDRLLIEELLSGLPVGRRRRRPLCTTTYWYYRACRAAAAGAGGHLSGPFERLPAEHQRLAILSLLELRDDITLPDPRVVVPAMAQLAVTHPKLNLLNLEAIAVAKAFNAEVWLSPPAAGGILPDILESERVPWAEIE